VLNTALMTAQSGVSFADGRRDRLFWGRVVESAVGGHLANAAAASIGEVFYWRERSHEVDFVVRVGKMVTAIEVKSGRARDSFPGLAAFGAAYGEPGSYSSAATGSRSMSSWSGRWSIGWRHEARRPERRTTPMRPVREGPAPIRFNLGGRGG
jgi:hypothetical protein